MKPIVRVILGAVALGLIMFVALRNHCPASGLGLNAARRDFHQLKNRTALPRQSDFDNRATLETLLQRGDDHSRWSTSRAARIEGYVVSLGAGPFEAANCYCRRDIHIMLAARPDAPSSEQVVLEVTPRTKEMHQAEAPATSDAMAGIELDDWSLETMKRTLAGHQVRFEGWLFFDSSHAGESENTAPGRANNWRATAWELHPITKIEIMK